ncbi:MAG: 4-(cytidine 5'-diphospho)-2-C-methyl-D-erythritol kinase [Candidatus Brocadiaceae bacterium]|nr:4-(cytidine 5'-diphospho)-2-C-methyl-D-erythritol kinase [Candidatus Brocadiaceae bacterium]
MSERLPGGRTLRVHAPAKVNVYLEVLGRRPDGYHEIRTVMQAVSLCDEVEFAPRADADVVLSCDHPGLGEADENLVVRAARALQARCGVRRGAEIRLRKRIPIGGGLGGGSSDCAVTLLALSHLWGLGLSVDALEGLAGELGSDIPFFVRGGTALCEGRGERVTPLECPAPMHYVLVTPACHSATGRVYACWRHGLTDCAQARKNVLEALRTGNAVLLAASLRNDLQETALALQTELRQLWERLSEAGEGDRRRGAMLTGSGSAFLVVAGGESEAVHTANRLTTALGTPCHAVRSMPAWNGSILSLTCGRGHR